MEGTNVLLIWAVRLIVRRTGKWDASSMTAIYRALVDPLVAPLLRKARKGQHADGPAVLTGVGLALGGGFARGFAHLGVLQVLEESRVPISCIAGTSVGSILGAAYASGVPLARIIAVCRNIRFKDFARWRISRLGLASNDRMAGLVCDVFNTRTFESLLIPTAVVATDLGTGEPVVFHHGNLTDAVRASCAFPGLFEPVRIGTRCLADGGLVAQVPTQAARELGAGCVIGVSVGFDNWDSSAPSNLFQVVARSISAVQKHQTQSWESFADLVLQPDVQAIDWDDFSRADEAIAAGVSVARQALPRIWTLLEKSASALQETFSWEPGSRLLEEVIV